MSSPSKEDTFAKGLVECRLKGSICRWLLPASINLRDLSKKFCLEFDDLRPFAVWVPSDLADHFVKMMNDKLHETEPGRSRCVRTKGVVLFGPPLRSGGEDEDATGGPASSDSRDRCIHGKVSRRFAAFSHELAVSGSSSSRTAIPNNSNINSSSNIPLQKVCCTERPL